MFLLHEILAEHAHTHAERPALIENDRSLTFAELDRRSDSLAAALQQWGVGRGDRVLLISGNSILAGVCIWGVLRAGGVLVPLAPECRAGRLRTIIEDCRPCALIAAPEVAATIAEALAGMADPPRVIWTVPPEGAASDPAAAGVPTARPGNPGLIDQDLAAIIYTSGTTGEPKGVMLTHRNFTNTTGAIASYLAQTPEDVVCCTLPLAFSYGLFQLLTSARAASTVVLEQSFAFPYDVLRRVQARCATMLPGVPTIFAKLIQMAPIDGVDLGSLRCMTNAAAPIPPTHVRRLLELFPGVAFFPMYGQTECTRASFLHPSLVAHHPDSVGGAIPNSEVSVVDERGHPQPAGVEGELIVRGGNLMRGYWGRPEETSRKLRDGAIAGEKVLWTGDRFRTDAQGLLYFISRADDIFKCRGEKVAPAAVEHVLCELPEVAEAGVVGVEDPNDGTAVKAVIVPRPDCRLSEARIRQHCRAHLEPHMVPRFIEIRESLPKTDSGKLRRLDLRAESPA